MPVTESGILCIDTMQDLIVVRSSAPGVPLNQQSGSFCCTPLSLSTGKHHPRARQQFMRFNVSERVKNKPHYTRLQVCNETLAVSTASGFQLFTEITIFDWTTGDQIAVSTLHATFNMQSFMYQFRASLLLLQSNALGAILLSSSRRPRFCSQATTEPTKLPA